MLPAIQLPDLNPEFVLQAMSEVYDWGLIDLHIPKIHRQTLGSGIKIAIIDSGESEHFEIENNKVASVNFTDSETLLDRNGHSTFVSGIVAAEKNNEGIIGVAPKASLYFAKGIDDAGRGEPASLVRSIDWSIKQGVDIISISAGMFFDFKPLHKIIQKAHRKNIIIVAATGNTGKRHYDVAFPARYPEVIGVAAYDKKHRVAKFSSRGINVTCAMPGVDIYSTHLKNNFCKSSGTSYACPIMTGICALILSKHRDSNCDSNTPCETPSQMMAHLKKYAIKMDNGVKDVGFGTIDLEGIMSD